NERTALVSRRSLHELERLAHPAAAARQRGARVERAVGRALEAAAATQARRPLERPEEPSGGGALLRGHRREVDAPQELERRGYDTHVSRRAQRAAALLGRERGQLALAHAGRVPARGVDG